MTIASGYAQYLKSAALYASADVTDALAKWGSKATTSTIISPIAFKSDAQAEAARQATFLAGPLARDAHVVKGQRSDLIGQIVTLYGDRLGYEGGASALVIGAVEAETGDTTTLTVLKRA